jgi:hypothetical protein
MNLPAYDGGDTSGLKIIQFVHHNAVHFLDLVSRNSETLLGLRI